MSYNCRKIPTEIVDLLKAKPKDRLKCLLIRIVRTNQSLNNYNKTNHNVDKMYRKQLIKNFPSKTKNN